MKVFAVCAVAIFIVGLSIVFVINSNDHQKRSVPSAIPRTVQKVQSTSNIEGFNEATLTVNSSEKKHCVALADTPILQAKGMMGFNSFGKYDAMIFPFESNTEASFYMANVVNPLSIAFFDESGIFISNTEMPICEIKPKDCPKYGANRPFRYAMETSQGSLDGMGIGAGSQISISSGCA